MAMTKKEVFTKAMEFFAEGTEEREVMAKAIAQLEKRGTKPTKAQIENAEIKARIKEYIAQNPGKRIGEIAQEMGYTPNKVNALVTQLVKGGEVERYEEKRVAYFR